MVTLFDTVITTILNLLTQFGNMYIPIFSNSNHDRISLFNLLLIIGVTISILTTIRRLAK